MTLTNKQISDHLIARFPDIGAIYLSGSRLNHLDITDTDYDVIVVRKSALTDVVNATPYSKEIHFTDTGANEIQAKVYDTLRLYHLIEKSNPNVLEIFYETPLYVDSNFEKLTKALAKPETIKQMSQINLPSFLGAVSGQYQYLSHVLEKDGKNVNQRGAKAFVQLVKFFEYFKDILNTGTIQTVDVSFLVPFKADFADHYDEVVMKMTEIKTFLDKIQTRSHLITDLSKRSSLQKLFLDQAFSDIQDAYEQETQISHER